MNSEIINNFIQFYIETFNNKTLIIEFSTIWKNYSTIVHNNTTFTGEQLNTYINNLYKYSIKYDSQNDVIISFMINGDRRANILLSYIMFDLDGNYYNVSQFILLAYSNNKEFWIHSSIFNLKI